MISVVVFAFNEEPSLETVVLAILTELRTIPGVHELLIIDDGSTDSTGVIADALAAQQAEVRVIHHGVNRGLGAAYRTAFSAVQGELVTFQSADGQLPVSLIGRFARLMEQADMVLGYVTNPAHIASPVALLLAHGERLLYWLLFGPLPRFKGALMFRRRLLDELELRSTGERDWVICMELILRAARGGYRVLSVPTALNPRQHGRSKVNRLPVIWATLCQVLKLRLLLIPHGRPR